jgi:hypothetical protein
MPKTRNVTRVQWDSANASHGSATRSRKDKENGYESEKENGSRQVNRATRSQTTRGRTGILGAPLGSATAGLGQPKGSKLSGGTPTKTQTATKGKGKPKAAPLKRKKMPLQDITAQFLPAPEPANRGIDHQNLTEEELAAVHAEPANIISTLAPVEAPLMNRLPAPKFTSPLPPSSPPSPVLSSPIRVAHDQLPKSLFAAPPVSPIQSLPRETYDPWQSFDDAHPAAQSSPPAQNSSSDPFGFVALERKLKAERETFLAQYHDHDADAAGEYDELEHVLVADTSSPRPVPRLRRSQYAHDIDEREEDEDNNVPSDPVLPPAVLPHVHYATPPSPHKDKQKRRRLSHEGHDIFSPCESSIESSPSPTKTSARKRSFQDTREDPLDEFNDELERSQNIDLEEGQVGKKTRRTTTENDAEPDVASRNLRPRVKKPTGEDAAENYPGAKRSSTVKPRVRKAAAKSRTVAKKEKVDEIGNEEVEDLEEVCFVLPKLRSRFSRNFVFFSEMGKRTTRAR